MSLRKMKYTPHAKKKKNKTNSGTSVSIWMGFFLTKYLIRFHDRKTRFTLTWLIFIAIWNNKIAISHLDPVFFTESPSFPPDPVFSTRTRVFHTPGPQPCVFHVPVFSTRRRVSNTPGPRPRVFHLTKHNEQKLKILGKLRALAMMYSLNKNYRHSS